jgi:uncharacterized protein YbaP (TraB family)
MEGNALTLSKITPRRRRLLRSAIAGATALVASLLAAASAQAQVQGLPMWVIKDADSTIYLTGTIHMLPAEIEWDSEKLRNAIKDADELWLEIPMGSDVMKFAQDSMPVMMKHAISTTPLSKLLTPEETAALKARIAEFGLPPETFAMLNAMKPWFATVTLSVSPLTSAGYDPTQGIDIKIAKLAEDDGDPIKGFETVEEQTKILASGTMEEQLAALRRLLAMPKSDIDAMKAEMDTLAVKWATGDIAGAEAMFADMSETDEAQFGGATMDALLLNRNENWAGQIEAMLKGSGTHFIAVGGGHLVGPDSVQERLKLRGIATERY